MIAAFRNHQQYHPALQEFHALQTLQISRSSYKRPSSTGAEFLILLLYRIYTSALRPYASALHQLHQKSMCLFKLSFIPMVFVGEKRDPRILVEKKMLPKLRQLNNWPHREVHGMSSALVWLGGDSGSCWRC